MADEKMLKVYVGVIPERDNSYLGIGIGKNKFEAKDSLIDKLQCEGKPIPENIFMVEATRLGYSIFVKNSE